LAAGGQLPLKCGNGLFFRQKKHVNCLKLLRVASTSQQYEQYGRTYESGGDEEKIEGGENRATTKANGRESQLLGQETRHGAKAQCGPGA
jgi:hypothetical protein